MELKLYYSTEEIADLFNVSMETVRYWRRIGRIEAIQIGQGHMKFSVTELEKIDPNFILSLEKFQELKQKTK